MGNIYSDRIEELRKELDKNDANWYLCTTSDPHGSEYINDHYKVREYLSGFTGSNGDLLVGPEGAWLWTDGRYFVQAAGELEGSGIELMRSDCEGVPELSEFIKEHVIEGDVLMFDGRLIGADTGIEIRDILKENGAFLLAGADPADKIWSDRPEDSHESIRILEDKLSGESYESKLEKIRGKMRELKCDVHIISALDDQMWLFNIRGGDVRYNPVCYAFSVITKDAVKLYVKEASVNDKLRGYASDKGFELASYDDFYKDILKINEGERVLCDPSYTSYLLLRLLDKCGAKPVMQRNPSTDLKAVKNAVETQNSRRIYLKDSLILTRFIRYMKEHGVRDKISEYEAALMLDKMRLEDEECFDLSFTTISAGGANAAMMHYDAEENNCAVINENEVYLVDSGGQYDGGTTDVTRTLIPVNASDELKKHFTKVCAGMLALQNAVFLKGVSGRNLDILSREPLWEMNIDYKCGTGHGVGYMLNVHEGPQNIRPKKLKNEDAEMAAGMLVSDEPGVYIEGKYGIRTENILLCVSREKNSDGEFLAFEPLTFVPIDLDGIDVKYFTDKERAMLNTYHRLVREKLSPFMNDEEKAWLENATREV